jgi:hypothetical protein
VIANRTAPKKNILYPDTLILKIAVYHETRKPKRRCQQADLYRNNGDNTEPDQIDLEPGKGGDHQTIFLVTISLKAPKNVTSGGGAAATVIFTVLAVTGVATATTPANIAPIIRIFEVLTIIFPSHFLI